MDEVASVKTNADGGVALEPVPTRPDFAWMAFRTPFGHGLHDASGELVLTDYASAGNAWSDADRLRVWMPEIFDPSRVGDRG